MSIYRKKFRSSDGKVKRSRFFTAEFRWNNRVIRQSGFVDQDHAKYWLNEQQLRLRRGATGYVKAMTSAQVIPLIEQFAAYLKERGRDEEYCYIAEARLKRLAGEAGWKTLGQVTEASLEAWKRQPSYWANRPTKPVSNRTKNQYIQISQEFGKWLRKPAEKLPVNPLADVDLLPAKHNDAYRRAATVDELNKLLATCPQERRLAYLFIIYCPLRRKTMERLTWKMLHLDANPPYGVTPGEINKSRRQEKFPIRFDVAQELRKAKGKSKSDEAIFQLLPTLPMLREDLARAGITFADSAGNRRIDFHALRKTLIRLCKLSGVSMDAASLLLHHKSLSTTRKFYDDDMVDPLLGDSIEKLPAIGKVRTA